MLQEIFQAFIGKMFSFKVNILQLHELFCGAKLFWIL